MADLGEQQQDEGEDDQGDDPRGEGVLQLFQSEVGDPAQTEKAEDTDDEEGVLGEGLHGVLRGMVDEKGQSFL